MRNSLRLAAIVGGLAVGLSSVWVAVAQTPASNIDQRKALMRANNGANQQLGPIIRGERPWDQSVAVAQADILASNGGKIPALFPAGSGPESGAETNALPAIWTNRADFEAKAKTLADEAGRLLQLARANDEAGFKAQFPKIGASCGGCHTPYRKPLQPAGGAAPAPAR
jgi:cytochrome c556